MLTLKRSPEFPKEDELGTFGWLEVYGETEPELSWGATKPPAKGAGLYEYRWALGYSGSTSPPPTHHRSPWPRRDQDGDNDQPKLAQLADPAAHVYLYFAADSNWRVYETLATVKNLATCAGRTLLAPGTRKGHRSDPARHRDRRPGRSRRHRHAGAGSIAETISRLKLTSVPQAPSAEWFVRRIDTVRSRTCTTELSGNCREICSTSWAAVSLAVFW